MAIEIKQSINSNATLNSLLTSPVKSAVSDSSSKTASPSFNTDVKKVPLNRQRMDLNVKQDSSQSVNSQEGPTNRNIASSTPDNNVSEPLRLNADSLEAVVSKLNDYVEQQKRDIRFSVDKDTDKTVVKLIDSNGEVLKQIPSEEVLAILKGIESNKGLFLQYEA